MKKLKKGWEHLKSERGPALGLLKTRYDHLKNPRNQKEVKVLVIEGRDAVNVLAFTKAQKIVLVRQLRFGTGDVSVEFPGGLMDEGEDRLESAKRELREETGYTGTKWEYLNSIASQPVFMDNYIHHYILLDAELTHSKDQDDAEDIEIIELTIEETIEMLKRGEFIHPHAISILTQFLLKTGYWK